MKNLILLSGILLGVIFYTSCKKEKEIPLSDSELLIQNSPWEFHNYEMIEILDSNGSSFTQDEIEGLTNQLFNGNSLTFNEDGTGSSTSNAGSDQVWEWELTNDSKIFFTLLQPYTDTTSYSLNISSTQLAMLREIITWDDEVEDDVVHLGWLIYK